MHKKSSKHGQLPCGAFLDQHVAENMERYLESTGSLSGMLVLKPRHNNAVPLKYVPDPEGDKREYDLRVFCNDVRVHGKIYKAGI